MLDQRGKPVCCTSSSFSQSSKSNEKAPPSQLRLKGALYVWQQNSRHRAGEHSCKYVHNHRMKLGKKQISVPEILSKVGKASETMLGAERANGVSPLKLGAIQDRAKAEALGERKITLSSALKAPSPSRG